MDDNTPEEMSRSVHEESESESSEGSFELPDALAIGREKRQTAGNRLRDMLNAELESEAIFAEDADDEDFGSDQDIQDDLDSDFDRASDDEPAIAEAEDAGEVALEKQEKDAARIKKRKAAEALNNPKIIKRVHEAPVPKKQVKQKKVTVPLNHPKRQSSRAHALEIAAVVERRLADDAEKKSKIVRALKVEEHVLTQEERLAEAKITEAANVASLDKLVQYEEERKANQKLLAARKRAIGPVVRFLSTAKPSPRSATAASNISRTSTGTKDLETQHSSTISQTSKGLVNSDLPLPSVDSQVISAGLEHHDLEHIPNRAELQIVRAYISFENFPTEAGEVDARSLLLGTGCHNKHEYPHRPICPFSGRPACYQDPETNIFYGNARAYASLQLLRSGTALWNPQLKMYVPETESGQAGHMRRSEASIQEAQVKH